MATYSHFCIFCLTQSNADSRLSHANEIVEYYKKSPWGNGDRWKEGVLHVSVTLLKSAFKQQAISARYYLLVMEGKIFDIRLIPEFSGASTDMPIVEWIENGELVCELCAMKNVEHVLPLRLRGGALAIHRQLSAEQKAAAEQIKQALRTAYAADAFNAYDQFITWQLHLGEMVDKFFAELRLLYCHLQHHNDTIIKTQEDFFNKILPLTLL